jgi:hypothetical protein
MRVALTYYDEASLTSEEVVSQARRNYGNNVEVAITPMSLAPHDYLYFALQQMVAHRQLALIYDDKELYQVKLGALRSEVLYKVADILDSVIIDNESKVGM